MRSRVLQLDPSDNVLIALTDLKAGESVEFRHDTYTLTRNVPAKHKFATQQLEAGDDVIMYGVLVGKAITRIARGELLSTSNIQHQALPFREQSTQYRWTPPDVLGWKERTFLGYRRSDGQVGTRNYWLVVPLVFCENKNIQVLKQALEEELGFAAPQPYRNQVAQLAESYRSGRPAKTVSTPISSEVAALPRKPLFENVDGIRFLLHEGGCGGTREDSNNLCSLIAGYIHHP